MSAHPLARILLVAVVAVAAAGCSRHATTTAQGNDDRDQGAQPTSQVSQAAPAAAQPPAPEYVRTERRREVPPRLMTVPAGTRISVRLAATVSSASATPGQRLEGELAAPLVAGGAVVAPAGTAVQATVETAVPSGRLARPARLALDLTSVRIADQWVAVTTSSVERTGATHTTHDTRFIAGGAAVGALVGQLLGGNHNTTLRGAALGAAAGTGAAAATGKLDVAIGPNEVLAFTLDQPLELRG